MVGANGSDQTGKIILSCNDSSDGFQIKVPTIGPNLFLSTIVKTYDTVDSDEVMTIDVVTDGNSGVLTFYENAGTVSLPIAQNSTYIFTFNNLKFNNVTVPTNSLQTAVDAINDGAGTAGSGDGTTEHGYLAEIVAAANGSVVNGTIKLTKTGVSADAAK